MDRFDRLMDTAQKSGASGEWRQALAEVADTAFICRAWLQEYMPDATAADLMTMVQMVADRKARLRLPKRHAG